MSSLERGEKTKIQDISLDDFHRWFELAKKLTSEGWLKKPRMAQKPPTTIGQWEGQGKAGRKIRYGNRLY